MGTKSRIEEKVFSYMEKYCMIEPGENVIVGCSGGADSVCLLFLLLEYSKKISVRLAVVHVNHGIRPDAGEDARYVESLCRERKLPFSLTEVAVREVAAREKCSEEDAGRRIRYEAFHRAAEEMGGAKIAVAHNLNDNAETMLLHLFRGSGLKGLCGIAAVREEIIRPILCLDRAEVEAYLEACQINWRRDSTNDGDDYSRNRIRHHVLPYVEERITRGAAEHMSRTAELLSETEDYLSRQTQKALQQCVNLTEESGRYTVEIGRFLAFHRALQKRMLLVLAERLSPTGKDISAIHVEDVLRLFERPGNRDISLPFGILAKRRYDTVTLERKDCGKQDDLRIGQAQRESGCKKGNRKAEEGPEWSVKLCAEELKQSVAVRLPGGGSLEFSKIFYDKEKEVPGNQCTKWLDYDKITESPVVRFRKTGDYFTIAGGDGTLVHKSLKDYMIAEKIPREIRAEIPVLAVGSHVIWLVGYRISEYFKVSGNTNYVLQVEWKEWP